MVVGTVPVPLRAEMLGDDVALLATDRVAFRDPLEIGLKKVVILQDAEAASVAAQVFDWENEVGLVPAMLMAIPDSTRLPVLVRVKT
jgi:hypothetical protein